MTGRTIKLYLVDGVPSGIMTAEIMNWTGKAIVFPRSQLLDFAKREDAKRTGVYFLIGEDLNNPLQDLVYVGESENVLERLRNHNTDASKEFWTRTVIFTSKDENLTKGHIRYIESQLIQIISNANRANLENGTNPDYKILPESDIADMAYFIEQMKLVLPVLGFNFAMPLSTLQQSTPSGDEVQIDSPILEMSYAGITAIGQEINAEFVVFKDSAIRIDAASSISERTQILRDDLLKSGILSDDGNGNLILNQNLPFKSPSAAAQFVTGYKINGRTAWKVKGANQTYADWQESQLNKVDQQSLPIPSETSI
jgi:hypothetical protein